MNINRFEVSRHIYNSSYSMPSPHAHSYCELYYLINGNVNYIIDGVTHKLTPGTIILVPPDVPHQTRYVDALLYERVLVEFSINYIPDITMYIDTNKLYDSLFNKPIHIPDSAANHIQYLCEKLLDEHSSDTVLSGCSKQLYLQNLIISALRECSIDQANPLKKEHLSDSTVEKAYLYIKENYKNPITLVSLAEHFNLNPSYFSTKFKTINGISFKECLNQIRLSSAERLLLESDKSITTIAMECGFESSNYFGDLFKKHTGVSPSEFRKAKGNIGK